MKLANDTFLTYTGKLIFPLMYLGKKRNILIHKKKNPNATFNIRNKSSDRAVLFETWRLNEYEDIRFPLKDLKIIVDVGAHIGDFSIFAACKSPNAQIYSFEPFQDNFDLLVKNIDLNKTKNIIPINKAVASKSRITEFYIPNNNGAIASLYFSESKLSQKIRTISLDKFMEEKKIKNIDMLKIDAEGAEYEIFYSLNDEVLKRIKYIAIEAHKISGFQSSSDELRDYLENKGFETKISSRYSLYNLFLGTKIIKAWRNDLDAN